MGSIAVLLNQNRTIRLPLFRGHYQGGQGRRQGGDPAARSRGFAGAVEPLRPAQLPRPLSTNLLAGAPGMRKVVGSTRQRRPGQGRHRL